jgi:large subunit ribosomal protein L32
VPVPKKKTSTSKRDMRRSHDSLTTPNTIVCSHCGEQKKRHYVCPSCGTYKNKEIIKKDEEK